MLQYNTRVFDVMGWARGQKPLGGMPGAEADPGLARGI